MEEELIDYRCIQCGDEWTTERLSFEESDAIDTLCPLCSMPITQMIHDVYKEEGVFGVIRQLYKRLK